MSTSSTGVTLRKNVVLLCFVGLLLFFFLFQDFYKIWQTVADFILLHVLSRIKMHVIKVTSEMQSMVDDKLLIREQIKALSYQLCISFISETTITKIWANILKQSIESSLKKSYRLLSCPPLIQQRARLGQLAHRISSKCP